MTDPDEPSAAPLPTTSGYAIPDFDKDAATIASFEDARRRFERREMQDAESRLRSQYTQKRDAIRAEIALSGQLLDQRVERAQKAFAAYAASYPNNVDGKRTIKPSLFQVIFSLGRASRLYNGAVRATQAVTEAQSLRRRKEHDEEELDQQLKRALYLQEDSLKKRLTAPEGHEDFHKRPGVELMWKRVQEIQAERAAYAARLERGEVPPMEQRERMFTEFKVHVLEAPFSGALIVKVLSFGDMHYFLLRDLERRLYSLPYDPRLEALFDQVIDVYRIADSFEVKLTRRDDGKPFTALDHYFACYKDEEVARAEFRKARTALRTQRNFPAMPTIDGGEEMLVNLLAGFARTIATAPPPQISPPV